jgi:hypothetical protein
MDYKIISPITPYQMNLKLSLPNPSMMCKIHASLPLETDIDNADQWTELSWHQSYGRTQGISFHSQIQNKRLFSLHNETRIGIK